MNVVWVKINNNNNSKQNISINVAETFPYQQVSMYICIFVYVAIVKYHLSALVAAVVCCLLLAVVRVVVARSTWSCHINQLQLKVITQFYCQMCMCARIFLIYSFNSAGKLIFSQN